MLCLPRQFGASLAIFYFLQESFEVVRGEPRKETVCWRCGDADVFQTVEHGSGGLIKPSRQLILGHVAARLHMTFQVVDSIEMALAFRALKLFGVGLEG